MSPTRGSGIHRRGQAQRQRGRTLIELLVGLLLGLVVAVGASILYLAHRQSYSLVEGVSRLAENERLAVDLLSREIREAGVTPCTGLPAASALGRNFVPATPSSNTWANWSPGLIGNVFGKGTPAILAPSGTTAQVAGTDSLLLWGTGSTSTTVKIASHNVGLARFTTLTNSGYRQGDVVIACNSGQLLTVQLSDNSAGTTVPYFQNPAITAINAEGFLSPLVTHVWYIGKTGVGKSATALRRLTVQKDGSLVSNDEIVRDVSDMQISYLEGNAADLLNVVTARSLYVDASAVVDWATVIAVRVTLTLSTSDAVGHTGTSTAKIVHPITFTVSLPSRLGAGA